MSSENGHSLERLEVASLPPEDPQRQELQARLTSLTAEDRAAWERELVLTDRLRIALADVNPPADMPQRLLSVMEDARKITPPAAAAKSDLLKLKVDWRVAAAVLLIVGLIGAYIVVSQPTKPTLLKPDLAHTLATYAVKNHAAAPLEIASADPAAVQNALQAHTVDFPVMLLQPDEGVTLEGGGICDFGPAKAAYTQWQGAGATYTLFEFNGKKFGIPAKFIPTTNQPAELWHDQLHYQVFFFAGSGGKCCWALVMESENIPNPFAQYGSAY